MATLYKEYAELENGHQIKFSINFNKETRNWATSHVTPVGYRVRVTPVEVSQMGNGIVMESIRAFTGFNDTLLQVDRQSKKRLEMAIGELQKRKELYIQQFMPGGNYEIK